MLIEDQYEEAYNMVAAGIPTVLITDAGKTEFDDVNSIPSSGYISDEAGYEDCQEVVLDKVYVNKNKDGTYTKFKVTSDDFRENDSGCNHKITIKYMSLQ